MTALVTRLRQQRLVGQGLPPPLPELPLVGNDEGRAEVVQRLAFVELAQEAAPILRMSVPVHNVQGARQPSIFLQGRGQGVLLRMGLQFLHQQRRRDPAQLHGTRHP